MFDSVQQRSQSRLIRYDELAGIVPEANQSLELVWPEHADGKIVIETNAEGFRSRTPTPEVFDGLRVLVLGTPEQFLPRSGSPLDFERKLAAELARDLGVDIEFVPVDYAISVPHRPDAPVRVWTTALASGETWLVNGLHQIANQTLLVLKKAD